MKRQPFDLSPDDPPDRIPYIYDLPAPNAGVHDIYGLVFGRQSYEDIINHPPKKENGYKNQQYWDRAPGKLAQHLRYDWRSLLPSPDLHALRYIWQDCESRFLLNKKEVYLALEVFDPDLLELMLVAHPKVIELTYSVVKQNFASHTFRPLMSYIPRFFRTDYRRAYEQAGQDRYLQYPDHAKTESLTYLPHTFEEKFQQAIKQIDKAAEMVAKFLVRHYCLYPEIWTAKLAAHADLSEYWKLFTTKAMEVPKPNVMQFVQKKIRPSPPPNT